MCCCLPGQAEMTGRLKWNLINHPNPNCNQFRSLTLQEVEKAGEEESLSQRITSGHLYSTERKMARPLLTGKK
ncbi:rCG27885 [Rattus norvegicus]|uniref:RCG27885 n=1 Tax=Rattus norvegicus TaxID=10116 RepID=A6IDU2_RAT|nr:rCG27885 [Rattus norvegicus]